MRRARIVHALFFAAFLALGAASPVHAVVNVKPYEDFSGDTSCQSASVCGVAFKAIPDGKMVVISRVSCRMEIASSSPIILKKVALKVLNPGGIDLFRDHFLTPALIGSEGIVRYYQINNDALHLYHAGKVPRIELQFGNPAPVFAGLNCQIGGTIE